MSLIHNKEHLNFTGILDCKISDHQMTLINANLMPPTGGSLILFFEH